MKKILYGGCFLLITIIICGCFSPWRGDEGNLSIVWGHSGNSRGYISQTDFESLDMFKVILKGPGGTIEEEFRGKPGASFSVIPGTWSVVVKGYLVSNQADLKAMGIEQIEVKTGKRTSEVINMYSAVEVGDWWTLHDCVDTIGTQFTGPTRPFIIVIKDSFKAENQGPVSTISTNKSAILVAEKPVTITRDLSSVFMSQFFSVTGGGTLTLGKPGMIGTITLDGSFDGITLTFYVIEVDGSYPANKLEMYDGVTIKNNRSSLNGSGVFVGQLASFVMNGGTIINNTANHSGTPQGGGVYVAGAFTMNGGTIRDNAARNILGPGVGGGVYVVAGVSTPGIFNQPYRGTISGNFPDNIFPWPLP